MSNIYKRKNTMEKDYEIPVLEVLPFDLESEILSGSMERPMNNSISISYDAPAVDAAQSW